MIDDFDELDRALFALPLETPPPGLRAAILRSTVSAQMPARTAPFATWEILALGTAIAVAVWLILLIVGNKASAVAVTADAVAIGRTFADPAILMWLAAGGAVAAWMTLAGTLPLVRKRSWEALSLP